MAHELVIRGGFIETFREYLDALDRPPLWVNVAPLGRRRALVATREAG
jgi:hypothetical protein